MAFDEKYVEAIAHPTIGIVLLGGLSDRDQRIPLHNSAGIAYTMSGMQSVARTRIYLSDQQGQNKFNGNAIDVTSRSPVSILELYSGRLRNKYRKKYIYFDSRNENILSGSSDAGAAALGKCIEYLLPEEDKFGLENNIRRISESVGRSIYGGLTITTVSEGKTITQSILDASDFHNYRILAFTFFHERRPSDDIHFNIKNLKEYPERVKSTSIKIQKLQDLARKKDIEGIFEVAHRDTEEYHSLVEKSGVTIITPDMREFMEEVLKIRRNVWCTYIVTGGNSVFIVVKKNDVELIIKKLENEKSRISNLMVSGGAQITSSNL
ncbi:MAG: mevalonate-3-kinase [Thermoplasmataceae archaeon]